MFLITKIVLQIRKRIHLEGSRLREKRIAPHFKGFKPCLQNQFYINVITKIVACYVQGPAKTTHCLSNFTVMLISFHTKYIFTLPSVQVRIVAGELICPV